MNADERRHQFVSIVWLRAVASLMVAWTHLVSIFGHAYNVNWLPLVLVEKLFNEPLAIINGFSSLGVSIFFVISGFIITHAALGETRTAFALKRLLRIYPPLFVSLVVASATLVAYTSYTGNVFPSTVVPTWHTFWRSFWLLNVFFIPDRTNINPVAWTLVLEMLFYISVFATLPLLKRRPLVPVLLQLALYGACALIPLPPEGLRHFSVCYGQMVLLFAGQALYLYKYGRISGRTFTAVCAAYYMLHIVILHTVLTGYYQSQRLIVVSTVWAFVLFAALVSVDARLPLPRVVRFFSDISYSLYLNHAVPGFILLAVLYPYLGYPTALAVAFAASVGISVLSFVAVERPAQRLARNLARRFGTTRQEPSAEARAASEIGRAS